jgi:hypothetical protein
MIIFEPEKDSNLLVVIVNIARYLNTNHLHDLHDLHKQLTLRRRSSLESSQPCT